MTPTQTTQTPLSLGNEAFRRTHEGQTTQTHTATPKTVAQIEAWIVDLERIKKQEGGAGDYRMYQAACLSLRTANRELADAKRSQVTA